MVSERGRATAPSTLLGAIMNDNDSFVEKVIGGAFTLFVLFMLVVIAFWLVVSYPIIIFIIVYLPVIILLTLWRRS